jgi:hypothetical protein
MIMNLSTYLRVLLLVIAFTLQSTIYAEGSVRLVEATGVGMSRDGALRNAILRAIQQGRGVQLKDRSYSKDHALAHQSTETYTGGRISSLEVLSERQKGDDLFEVRIRAAVPTSEGVARKGAKTMLQQRLGMPSVKIITTGMEFGQSFNPEMSRQIFLSGLEDELQESKFRFKEDGYTDYELHVTGSYKASAPSIERIGAEKFKVVDLEVYAVLKMKEVSSEEILFKKTAYQTKKLAFGKYKQNRYGVLVSAIAPKARNFFSTLMDRLNEAVNNGFVVDLFVDDSRFDFVRSITHRASKFGGVLQALPGFTPEGGRVQLLSLMDARLLADQLSPELGKLGAKVELADSKTIAVKSAR